MAVKTLFRAWAAVHNDDSTICEKPPVHMENFYVLAKNPGQVSSKMMKTLGDRLIFIEQIEMVASSDSVVYNTQNSNVVQIVG